MDICAEIAVRTEKDITKNNYDSFIKLSKWEIESFFVDVFICISI